MKSKNGRARIPAAGKTNPAAGGAGDSLKQPVAQDMTGRRRWCLRVASAVLIPAVALAVLELTLRLSGYGYPTSFFVRSPVAGEHALVENSRFSRRYFSAELVRVPRSLAFAGVKPARTLRIFVFGESAAEGDPEPAFGFARVLQVLLSDRFPDRRIEIINTAVTAINSHVIRPIAKECASYSGDLWVVYMGNNEVIGPFGAGTVFGAQTPPLPVIRASIWWKASRTGQLLSDALQGLSRRGAPLEWEGMEMFLKQQVRQSDPRMASVYAHFESNLSDIIAFGVGSGAKVVVSTVGSNLRDCPPFGSLHRAELSAAKVAEWEASYQAGINLETQRKYDQALAQYGRAAQVDDPFAELHFRMGRCLLAQGRDEEARRQFTLARDLDTLRFRADSRLNEIIRRVSGEWRARGVRLADAEAACALDSPNGISGEESFYEHVHLTFQGNYLVARQLAEQAAECLRGSAGSKDAASPASASAPSELRADSGRPFLSAAECAERLGLTDWDRLWQAAEMQRRTSRPPFTHQLDHAVQTARREEIVSSLRKRDSTNFQSSASIYGQALARAEDDWQLHDDFAGALLQHGESSQAAAHWRRVAELLPHRLQTYDLLGSVLLEQGKLDEAQACYQRALSIQPDLLEGRIGLGRVCLGQKRGDEALKQFRRAIKLQPRTARPRNHLGVALLQLGESGEADRAFREAIRVEPDFLPARLNLGKALAKQGRLEEALEQYREAARRLPYEFDAHYTLANTLVRLNKLPEAADHFAAALRLRPGSFESHFNYGTILAGQGQSARAIAEFEEVLRLKPDFAPAHLNLGIALSAENQLPEAIAHFQAVLRQEPGNERAQKLMEASLVRQKAAK